MRHFVLLCVLIALSARANSAEEPAIDRGDIRGGQKAVLLKDHKPNFPASQINLGGEGWTVLYYNIDEQGQPVDIVPTEFAGPRKFVDTAIESLQHWRYKPATSAGVPVPQFGNQVLYRFMLGNAERTIGKQRLELSKTIQNHTATGQLDAAREALDQAFASNLNVYEIAMFNVLRADLARVQKNFSEEILYLQRARRAGDMLSNQANRAILARIFIAAARAQDVDTGIETFRQLEKTKSQIKEWPKYEDVYKQLVELRDSQRSLAIQGVILDDGIGPVGTWAKELRRHAFEFDTPKGNFSKFELRCDQKFFTAKVDEGRSWQVPPSWGDCMLLVFGDVGASFTLVELPNQFVVAPGAVENP
jgi:hypothetical protein